MFLRVLFISTILGLLYALIYKIIFKEKKDTNIKEMENEILSLIEERFKNSTFKERLVNSVKGYLDSRKRLEEKIKEIKRLEKTYGKKGEEILLLENNINKIDENLFKIHKSLIKEKIKKEEKFLRESEKNLEKILVLTENS